MQFTLRVLLSLIAATAVSISAGVALAADPSEIADQVFQIYVDTLEDATALLAGTPPAEDVMAELDALKENSVIELVALGREIAAMNDRDLAAVEGAVNRSISSIVHDPETKKIYDDYQAVWLAYRNDDKELFQTIVSLNILTQYAFFDLLRKQEPDEADRFGV